MQTTLNLLTRDGAVYMSFSPSLKADQYAELLALSNQTSDADELRIRVSAWAAKRGLRYSFDPVKDPA